MRCKLRLTPCVVGSVGVEGCGGSGTKGGSGGRSCPGRRRSSRSRVDGPCPDRGTFGRTRVPDLCDVPVEHPCEGCRSGDGGLTLRAVRSAPVAERHENLTDFVGSVKNARDYDEPTSAAMSSLVETPWESR